MLSKLSGLIAKNVFFVSHQKTMLRRRKETSKKQKVAKKKFLEHDPKGSYTNELRILQIQKQLDKKVSKNYHLNELMDELFYPDVRYANQKMAEQNLLKISIDPQENLNKRKSQINSNDQITEQQYQEFDELAQQIYLCQIPSQLFELYHKNSQLFAQHHLITFLEKLEFYFKNKRIIQQRVTEKWKQSLDKLKLTDVQKKKRKRCPYIFIDRDELIREEEWNKIVKDLNKKISLSTEHILNQSNEENPSSQQFEPLDESFYSLQNNCDLAIQIKIAANYLPEQIFQSIIQKAFAIMNLEQIEEKSEEKIPIFSHSKKVKLLAIIGLKSTTKSTLTKSLHIDLPEASQKQEQKIISFGKMLCEDILKSNQCSADDLGTIILSEKGQYKFLDYPLLQLAKQKMLKFLSKTSLQRSIDYIRAFWQNGETKDSNFIEVLIFDIYRKLPFSVSKSYLFDFLSYIRDSQLSFRESRISIKVSQIYPRIVESVSKYINRNALTHEEVKTLMNSIYDNFPLYKAQSRGNILEMITTSIVKMGEGFKLQQLTDIFFRTTILGHRSKIFSKYVFERYQKEYKNLMKQYKSQKVQLIADKNIKDQNQEDPIDLPSMKEIVLEQNLLMMFWSYVINLNSQNASLPLNDMIEMFPLSLYSHDVMVDDLRQDLNICLKEYNFFPQIKNKSIEVRSKNREKVPLINSGLLMKTNTNEQYRHRYNESIAFEIMQKLEEGRQPIQNGVFEDLLFYLMRFSLVHEMKSKDIEIPQRWNDGVRIIFSHRTEDFDKIQSQFMETYAKNKEIHTLSFSSRLMAVLKQKQGKVSIHKEKGNVSTQAQKPIKLYQLL